MPHTSTAPLNFYATHSRMTDPRSYIPLLAELPPDIPALCTVVQGLVIHFGMGNRYGVELAARRQEARLRAVAPMLARIRELDPAPLTHTRPPAQRLVGSCRASTVLFCAFLRAQGVPARARSGFSTYFADRFAGDHWVGEYWHAAERRWVLVDTELDDLLRTEHHIAFDPCDVPRDQWVSAGQAWQGCRAGAEDPTRFGLDPSTTGLWYIRAQLVHDLAALNKMEVGPWDRWGLGAVEDTALTDADLTLLDHVAGVTQAGNDAFNDLRATYEDNEALTLPPPLIWEATAGS